MTDLSPFAAEGYDPKQWINEACTAVPEGDSLERCIFGLQQAESQQLSDPAPSSGLALLRDQTA